MSVPFEDEWARCSPWIEAALEYGLGTHTLDDVRRIVGEGHAQFWPGRSGAIVTEIQVYPQGKVLHFWLAGGDFDELVQRLRPAIEAWGRAMGCTRSTITGRPGWLRAMKPHGYAPQWATCMKELPDE